MEPFQIHTSSSLDIGSSRSPVTVLPDYTFPDLPYASSKPEEVVRKLANQLSSTGIYPIGLVFSPMGQSLIEQIREWSRSFYSDSFVQTFLPPGTYPIGWPSGRCRDILSASSTQPASLYNILHPSSMHVYFSKIELFLKLFLASTVASNIGPPMEPIPPLSQRVGMASVTLAHTFLITLPAAIGHRDFLRIVPSHKSCSDDPFTTDPATSLLLAPNCDTSDNPWCLPHSDTSDYMVTYVALPSIFDPSDMDSDVCFPPQDEDEDISIPRRASTTGHALEPNVVHAFGVHVTATHDVGSGRGIPLDRSDERIFEFVKPQCRYPTTRQFLLPVYSAIVLPASVAVRFSSHPTKSMVVFGCVHHVPRDNEIVARNAVVPTVPSLPFPFISSPPLPVLTTSSQQAILDSIRHPTPTNWVPPRFPPVQMSQSPSSKFPTATLTIGTIPIFKTIDSVPLRALILDNVPPAQPPQSTGNGNVSGKHDVVTIMTAPWTVLPMQLVDVYVRHEGNAKNTTYTVSDIPFQMIGSVLESKDIDVHHFSTSCLKDMGKK